MFLIGLICHASCWRAAFYIYGTLPLLYACHSYVFTRPPSTFVLSKYVCTCFNAILCDSPLTHTDLVSELSALFPGVYKVYCFFCPSQNSGCCKLLKCGSRRKQALRVPCSFFRIPIINNYCILQYGIP